MTSKKFGNIFEFRVIRDRISKVIIDDELELDDSKAFLYFFMQQYFDLDKYDALDTIVDGPNDFGIDAVYIDDSGERAEVYLVQSKYYQKEDRFDRALDESTVEKMILAIRGLITNPGSMPEFTNTQLALKLEDISRLGADTRYRIIFVSNSYPLVSRGAKRIQEFVDEHNQTSEFLSWCHVGLADYAKLLPNTRERTVSGSIQLTGEYMLHDIAVARALIGRISGAELSRIVDEHGDLLFEKNVRGYLKKSNQVNKKIRISASSQDSKKFFFLNNGITIVCKNFDFNSGLGESPVVSLQDFQIVNGGQTTNSIAEVNKEGKLNKKVSVLIRIVQTTDDELLRDITEATNSQTLVKNRDLHSNDPIQKLIEEYFETKEYYYEARRNKYQGLKPVKRRIDADKAVQTYYAYHFQKPADAKTKKSKLFGELYPLVFDQDDFNKERFLFAYLLYKKLYDLRSKFKDFGFLRDAELTSLALFRDNTEIHAVEDLDDEKLLEQSYTKILKAIKKVLDEEAKSRGADFEKRRFFISQDTLGRAQESL